MHYWVKHRGQIQRKETNWRLLYWGCRIVDVSPRSLFWMNSRSGIYFTKHQATMKSLMKFMIESTICQLILRFQIRRHFQAETKTLRRKKSPWLWSTTRAIWSHKTPFLWVKQGRSKMISTLVKERDIWKLWTSSVTAMQPSQGKEPHTKH